MPKKKSQKMTKYYKVAIIFRNFLRHLEFLFLFFVSGITFLYILTSTDGKIVAGFRFSNKIYHFSRVHFNMESYGKKTSDLKLSAGRVCITKLQYFHWQIFCCAMM